MSSTLLLGLGQSGVTGRMWSRAFALTDDQPDSFDASIGYKGVWDVRGTTPDEFSLGFQTTPAGPTRVWLRAPGFEDQKFDCIMPDDGAKEIRMVPVVVPLPRLTAINSQWHRMVDEHGRLVYGKGADAFLLFKKWLDGKRGEVDAVLEQLRDEGVNLIRLMGMFESLGGFNPKAYPTYYAEIRPFMGHVAGYGIYGLWTACAATGTWMNEDEAVEHVRQTVDELKHCGNTLFSPVNEQGQHNNSINRQRVYNEILNQPDVWFLYDTGSFGVDLTCEPPLGKFCVLHTVRSYPNMVKDCNIIDNANHSRDGKELGIDENYRMGDDGSGDDYANPGKAAEAAGTAHTALFYVIHTMQGERADVLTGNTLDCFRAAMSAMKGR